MRCTSKDCANLATEIFRRNGEHPVCAMHYKLCKMVQYVVDTKASGAKPVFKDACAAMGSHSQVN